MIIKRNAETTDLANNTAAEVIDSSRDFVQIMAEYFSRQEEMKTKSVNFKSGLDRCPLDNMLKQDTAFSTAHSINRLKKIFDSLSWMQ